MRRTSPYYIKAYEYHNLLMDLMSRGHTVNPRGKEIRELNHVRLVVFPDTQIYSYPVVRPVDKLTDYWFKEVAWYMSGDRTPDYIKEKAKLWSKITNPDNTLNSNYGYLVFYHKTPHPSMGNVTMTPFEWAVYSLLNDVDSRQAVMTYNNGGYNFKGNTDYICTQHQSFLIRDYQLNCYIALRSSDSIFGLPYNCMWWSLVHQQLYLRLKKTYDWLELGHITVDIYSSHIYEKHYELVRNMMNTVPEIYSLTLTDSIPLHKSLDEYLRIIPDLVEIKKNVG